MKGLAKKIRESMIKTNDDTNCISIAKLPDNIYNFVDFNGTHCKLITSESEETYF